MGKVLIVEDDVNLQKMYTTLLFSEGYEVVTARDKESALAAMKDEDISFVLLDYMLAEDTNGMEFLEELKASDEQNEVPIVMLTNNITNEGREKALALGVKEYLPKAKQSPAVIVEIVKKYTS